MSMIASYFRRAHRYVCMMEVMVNRTVRTRLGSARHIKLFLEPNLSVKLKGGTQLEQSLGLTN